MLEPDNIVGEISDPQGTLKVGNVGDTECVCLSYSSNSGKPFSVVYTARELSSLLAAIKKGAELAPNAKPRSTTRLAALPAKPVRLQIVLAAPENKSALLILRFLGPGLKQDVFSQPDALVALFQKTEKRAPMPAVVGILDRFGTNVWMIEGQTLEVNDKLSHGTGFFGEYIHHSEVPEGQVVRAWFAQQDDKKVVCAFEFAQRWEPTQIPDLPQGQQGDRALSDGLVRHSREIHALLSKTMYETRAIDPVWSAKIALASMIGDILMADDKAGGATWSGEGGNPVLKAGIESLRSGNVSGHDRAVYAMVSSYFHAKFSERAEAIEAINQEMGSALAYADHNAPEMKHLILNNWALLLREKGAQSGGNEVQAWMNAKQKYSHTLRPTIFCLPDTYPWVKTWQPSKTGAEGQAKKVQDEPQIKPGPVQLPPVHDKPVEEASAAPRRPSEELEEIHDEPLEASGPFQGMKTGEKKKLPLVPIMIGLVLIAGPLGYYLASGGDDPVATPSPTPTLTRTATPKPRPAPTQTPEIPKSAPLPAGDLRINGLTLDGKSRDSDILALGYKMVEDYTDGDSGIARYTGPKGTVMANLKMPARLITALQGDMLTLDGKSVANLETLPESFEGDKRFSSFKLQAVVDGGGAVRGYTDALEGIYVAEPLLDAPDGSLALSRKIRDENFFESLPKDFVNMYMTDGNPLLFQFLGANRTERLKYLLDQGANPNLKSWINGGTALHHCDNVKTAELLLSLGADPTITNNDGKTPAETATLEELKVLLAVPETTATPAATVTPGVKQTPAATPTAEATAASPDATPSPTESPTPAESPVPNATP